jgi:hypothetical protein
MNVEKKNTLKHLTLKDNYNSSESVFMALIFQQQKMISKLINKLSTYKVSQKK